MISHPPPSVNTLVENFLKYFLFYGISTYFYELITQNIGAFSIKMQKTARIRLTIL